MPLPWHASCACAVMPAAALSFVSLLPSKDRSRPPTHEYTPRRPEDTLLHRVVRTHLETFLQHAAELDHSGVPRFVEKELRGYLRCGVLAHGFSRIQCGGCNYEHLVPLSCKGRGICPSCGGRRMTALAQHLTEHVIPHVPVRQFVLSFPHRLRYWLAYDHARSLGVLRVVLRAVFDFYRRGARHVTASDRRTGSVTFLRRFGSAGNLSLHFHVLVLDGVFTEAPDQSLRFIRPRRLRTRPSRVCSPRFVAVFCVTSHVGPRPKKPPARPTDSPTKRRYSQRVTRARSVSVAPWACGPERRSAGSAPSLVTQTVQRQNGRSFRLSASEDRGFVAVERDRFAVHAEVLLSRVEVVGGGLAANEEKVHETTGRVVDVHQQSASWSTPFEPLVIRPIDLDESDRSHASSDPDDWIALPAVELERRECLSHDQDFLEWSVVATDGGPRFIPNDLRRRTGDVPRSRWLTACSRN